MSPSEDWRTSEPERKSWRDVVSGGGPDDVCPLARVMGPVGTLGGERGCEKGVMVRGGDEFRRSTDAL